LTTEQTTAVAVAPRQLSGVALMKHQLDRMGSEFKKALPGHISPEKFVRTAQTAIALTRNIEKANPASLMAACSKAAADGLILDGREAALVVDFRGDVQYRPMMRGLLKLAHNSGAIHSLVVEVAREQDDFTYSPTSTPPITHEIDLRKPRGDVFAVYALATLKSGGIVHDVMTVEDINRIRDRSDAWKAFANKKISSTPWSTDWSEMARKTVFRRLSKYLPSSTDRDDFHQAVERIDDDYGFEAEADATEQQAVAGPAPKKRGGAAAALKDITLAPNPPKATQATALPEHDEDGVIQEQDEGYAEMANNAADPERQQEDDI
jgi:recombination protein RecT